MAMQVHRHLPWFAHLAAHARRPAVLCRSPRP